MVTVLSRPSGLARYLGLAPWEYHDVLGTLDNRYLNDVFDLLGILASHFGHICGKSP